MLECELVEKLTKYLDRYKLRYAKEIRMGVGLPDVSINIGASKSMDQITDYYQLILCEYLTANKSVYLKKLLDDVSLNKIKVMGLLNDLETKKIVKIKNEKVYLNKKIFGRNLGVNISIEAKIKDWKSGLIQAERYLTFSDYSYLVMPEEKVKNVDMLELERLGLGLLSISGNGELKEVYAPRKSEFSEYKQKYLLTSNILNNAICKEKRRKDLIFHKLSNKEEKQE